MDTSRATGAISRRTVVAGIGAATLAGAVGCTTYGGPTTPTSTGPGPTAGGALGSTADIPVGGGKVFADADVVVTQPEEGTFKGFSATCTHQGCTVSGVADGTINCDCHGSKFAAADAAAVSGPASRPLPPKQLRVQGGQISLE